jgi:carboxyl-terminal processing protease
MTEHRRHPDRPTDGSPGSDPAPRRGSVPWIVSLALASVLGALLFTAGYLAAGAGGGTTSCAAPDPAFDAFCEAYEQLQRDYVDDLDPEKLAEGAIEGMFQYGVEDPYSGYMPPEEYQTALGDLSGTFSGIGAEMAIRNTDDPEDLAACTEFSDTCLLVVLAPLAGSPAEEAGVQAGDVVVAVDGEPVDGSTMNDQIARIRGEAGTDVTLTLRRDEDAPFDLTITRREITLQEVEARLIDGHIGYIALNAFSAPASEQFAAGLRQLLEEGADQIVFDLRDNPGGYIDAAQQIASQFIADGVIFTQESAGDEVRVYEATGEGAATDPGIPVVLLVNGGSASASEIVAAALQESGRATVVGEPTFGKNTVQVWSRLENEGGVRITISRWFTPDHNSVAPDGIQPDIVAARTPETPPEEDPALEAALTHLAGQEVAEDVGPRAPPPSVDASPVPSPEGFRPGAVVGIVAVRGIC